MESKTLVAIKWTIYVYSFLAIINSISLLLAYKTANPIITRFSLSLSVLNIFIIVSLLAFLSTFVLNKQKIHSQIIQIFLVLGMIILLKGRIQMITGEEIITIFPDNTILWENFGVVLIGIAILIIVFSTSPNLSLMIRSLGFQFVFGLGLFTYIVGVFFQKYFKDIVGAYTSIKYVNPIVPIMFFTLSFTTVVARPIWILWVKSYLFENKK